MTEQEPLASLQIRAAMAEATARLVAARELEDTLSRSVQIPDAAQLPRGTARV